MTNDRTKTKAQLIAELDSLRQRIAELEAIDTKQPAAETVPAFEEKPNEANKETTTINPSQPHSVATMPFSDPQLPPIRAKRSQERSTDKEQGSTFNLVAFYDRFAALGRAMQSNTEVTPSPEISKLVAEIVASRNLSGKGSRKSREQTKERRSNKKDKPE